MGGIPVDKSKPGKGLTDVAIENMKKLNGSLIAMSPEGTRAKVKEWKTGFLRIASEIKADIVPASLDFKKKESLLGEIFKPTIPLIKTVIGGAVKEKTWQIVKIVKFLLSIL